MLNFHRRNILSAYSSFSTPQGAEEFYMTCDTNDEVPFFRSLEELHTVYSEMLRECGLSEDTQVFCRFYLSDIANQKEELLRSRAGRMARSGAVSIIQQSPLSHGPVSLLAYHVKNAAASYEKKVLACDTEGWRNGAVLTGKHYALVLTANFSGNGDFDAYNQTGEIFRTFNGVLKDNGLTLLGNTVRKWIYVRDIDNHYNGMVKARREYFAEHGLTSDTRFIASTGIEGKLKETDTLVSLDAISIKNLRREQIIRMEALDHLCPTIDYGVTFERGSRIQFGDRSHLYISGTASIDSAGKILYPGDVIRQTSRTIENIRALLAPHGADLADMAYLIVYLRDFKEQPKVMQVLEREIPPEIPLLFVEGAVCRPSWLVEIEGTGIIPDANEYPPFL